MKQNSLLTTWECPIMIPPEPEKSTLFNIRNLLDYFVCTYAPTLLFLLAVNKLVAKTWVGRVSLICFFLFPRSSPSFFFLYLLNVFWSFRPLSALKRWFLTFFVNMPARASYNWSIKHNCAEFEFFFGCFPLIFTLE